MADARASDSQSNATWLGESSGARATLTVGRALGAHGIMSAQPAGAQGRLHDSDFGVAGWLASPLRDGEPPMSGIARECCIPAIPGMSATAPSPAFPVADTQVNPLPTSVSWASRRMAKNAVTRRRRITVERYRRTRRGTGLKMPTTCQDMPHQLGTGHSGPRGRSHGVPAFHRCASLSPSEYPR